MSGAREKTLQRMGARVNELIEGFSEYCDTFDQANLFSGPSNYFHFKTLKLLREHQSVTQAIQDSNYLDSLYAMLASWGMHRMGPTGAKLAEMEELKKSLSRHARSIQELEYLIITEIEKEQVEHVVHLLWNIISNLKIGLARTKIVAGSKALHHLLPDLIPPIDRQYTLRFFYNNTSLNRGDEIAFREMYPRFHQIAVSCESKIESRLGRGMNTSITKVIDNAIVGYGLKHLKKKKMESDH